MVYQRIGPNDSTRLVGFVKNFRVLYPGTPVTQMLNWKIRLYFLMAGFILQLEKENYFALCDIPLKFTLTMYDLSVNRFSTWFCSVHWMVSKVMSTCLTDCEFSRADHHMDSAFSCKHLTWQFQSPFGSCNCMQKTSSYRLRFISML